jgi:hypothetical protein
MTMPDLSRTKGLRDLSTPAARRKARDYAEQYERLLPHLANRVPDPGGHRAYEAVKKEIARLRGLLAVYPDRDTLIPTQEERP